MEDYYDFVAVKAEAVIPHNKLNGNDDDVEGVYIIYLNEPFGQELAGSAALDIFHRSVPVKVLDDFQFTPMTVDGEILDLPDDDVDKAYQLQDEGGIEQRISIQEWENNLRKKEKPAGP